MDTGIKFKITDEDDPQSASSPGLKKRPDSLSCGADCKLVKKVGQKPTVDVQDLETKSSTPRIHLPVESVVYPFKRTIDGKIEQFVHTPTSPNSDPRRLNSAYVMTLKTNSSNNGIVLSVNNGSQQGEDTTRSDLQPKFSSTVSLIADLQDGIKRSSKKGKQSRRKFGTRWSIQELIGLKQKSSRASLSSTGSTHLSVSSRASLHPLDNHSARRFVR